MRIHERKMKDKEVGRLLFVENKTYRDSLAQGFLNFKP